jgi:PAS domain S-box-containing protein
LRPHWRRYLVALLVMGIALSLRAVLDPWLGERVPYITLFGGIIVAAWYGGAGPALAAAAAGWLGAFVFFVDTILPLELVAYALSSLLIAGLGGAMHRARRDAEANEQRFRGFMQHSPNGVFIKDEEGRYVFMNRVGEKLAGTTSWRGKTDADLLPPEIAQRIMANDREVLESDAPTGYHLAFPAPDGTRKLRSVKFPLRDPEGRRYVAAVTMDVTAEQEAQRQLQTIADALPAVVLMADKDLRFRYINQLGAEWMQRAPQDVVGKPVAELIGEGALAEIRPHLQRVLAGERLAYEREVEYPAIGRRWARVLLAPVSGGFVAVTTDIHDRKRMEQALQEADRRKDQFIATLAHELRNPLAPIRMAVSLLANPRTADTDRKWALGVVERQVAHMARLIDDLLDMARITSGKLLLRKEHVLLTAVVEAALETSRPAIDAARHQLVTSLPPTPVMLHADPTRLAQVLANLLNNAAKYTPPGGVIELSAEVAGGEIVLAVRDNGMGFPAELGAQLFEPFMQWAPAEAASAGLGIGLALVRGIVALHDGTASAASAGPGKGSRFEVRLPLADAAQPGERAAPAELTASGAGQRVLVADDNRDAADTLCRLLAMLGYEARAAYDGTEAIALCESFRPHVAVLDIGMPGRSGYEVAQRVRARHGREIRLVALTGWGSEADVERARDAGFDQHLTKPVDPAVLGEVLALSRQ